MTTLLHMMIKEDDPFEILVAEGLSQLGKSADGTMQVFLSLSLKVTPKSISIENEWI